MNNSIFRVRRFEEANLGGYLKERRLKMGLSLEKVSLDLAISQKHLKALEENDLSLLPPEVYVKGFLQRYARFLELDEHQALFLFEKNSQKIKQVKFPRTNLPLVKVKRLVNYRNLVFLAVIFLLIIIVAYLLKVIWPVYQNPSFSLESPSKCPFASQEGSLKIAGQTQPESKIWINDKEVVVEKNGYFECSVFLNKGENQIQFKIKNKFGREKRDSCLVKY